MKILHKIIESVDSNGYKSSDYSDILHNSESFRFQMLGRLQRDMEYYYGFGSESESVLWAKDLDTQINLMKDLFNSFPEDEKPEWITMEDIEGYNRKVSEGIYDSNKEFADVYGDELMNDFKNIDKTNSQKPNKKSPAVSYVLQTMDSYEDAHDDYQKIVNDTVIKFGVDKDELERELDIYI